MLKEVSEGANAKLEDKAIGDEEWLKLSEYRVQSLLFNYKEAPDISREQTTTTPTAKKDYDDSDSLVSLKSNSACFSEVDEAAGHPYTNCIDISDINS